MSPHGESEPALQGEVWFGVDVFEEDIADNFIKTVWEPAIVKINAITAAAEACCIVLSVDETVANPKSKIAGTEAQVRNDLRSTF